MPNDGLPPDPRELLDALATHTISRVGVAPEELNAELAQLGPRWTVAGGELKLELKGGTMTANAAIVAHAAALADELDHHPRIVLEWAGIALTIHTHDAKAITVLDVVFAARLEQWLRLHGRP
jgi:4a-hydroxytetrahydrobiopterin dehydratase